MVCDWKPNSSRELNDPRMPDGGPSVPDQNEDNGPEDELNPAELGHYQLLPSDMQQGIDNFLAHASDSSDSDEDSDENDGPVQGSDSNVIPLSSESHNSIQTPQHKLEGWEKSDIRVDSEEIRSLMRGFNLPDSAVPDWASTVPESMFASFVWDRIKPK